MDGLRALAVVPVVLFHAGFGAFSGGFVGVDVFFVISGYLITTIIQAELAEGRFSITTFYERRARRILPALFLVLAVCLPFAWAWLLPPDLQDFSQGLVAVALFASNILFWRTSGYFDTAAELKPLLHTWSLAVEEQFYLFFPLFLMAAWRWGRRRIVGLLLVASLLSLALAQWGVLHKPDAAFYLLPTRAWELAIGALLALHLAQPVAWRPAPAQGRILETVGLALLLWGMLAFDTKTPFPGLHALPPTLGTALIILCSGPTTPVGRLLSRRVLVGIGLISYSAYLWHQPMFAFARHRTWQEPTPLLLAGLALAAFGLAWLSWRFVERPFRQKGVVSRRTVFRFAGWASLAMIGIGVAGHLARGGPQRDWVQPFAALWADRPEVLYPRCTQPGLLGNGIDFNFCLVSRRGAPDAVLLGDSHADDKYPGIEQADQTRHWALMGQSSCPPALGIDVRGAQPGCEPRYARIVDWLVAHPEVRTVAISYLGQYADATSFAADHIKRDVGPGATRLTSRETSATSREDILYYGMSRTVARLVQAGKAVVLVVDIPELPFFPVDCLKGRPDCALPLAQVQARQAVHRRILQRLQQQFPQVRVFDPTPLFCTAARCTYRSGETVLYRDSHHLTAVGSGVYGEAFVRWLGTPP
ncbi:MAG: acyltransferase family protein [Aquabacterium sp.]